MTIYFYDKNDNILATLKSDARPFIGDGIFIDGKEYMVVDVTWYLEKAPAQSGLKITLQER